MFKQETVFILGAGASWHYGYPTGEQLVKRVIKTAHQVGQYLRETTIVPMPLYVAEVPHQAGSYTKQFYLAAAQECYSLAKQLELINPLVIDYFLADHCSLRRIGKLMIALVLLDCESQYEEHRVNPNRQDEKPPGKGQDDWYRFLIHRLTVGCKSPTDLSENKVTFVTFNYDVSLETRIVHNLSMIEKFGEQEASKFFWIPRILHVYGCLRSVETHSGGRVPPYPMHGKAWSVANHQFIVDALNLAYEASKRLRTIASEDKDAEMNALSVAREVIEKAKTVYILGYGFDKENSRLLNIDSLLKYDHARPMKRVMFTNYQDSNRVNKEASLLFSGTRGQIFTGSDFISRRDAGEIYIERSARNVYDAFSLDFDDPEQV